jgi:hypothetical protein
MTEIIFYDPDNHHRPLFVDLDILYLQCLQCLYRSVLTSNHTEPIVCICCLDLSTIVNELQRRRQNVLIYLCKGHGGREMNPTFHGNVRDNIVFSLQKEWKHEILLDRMKLSRNNGNKRQASEDLEKLIISGEELWPPRISIKVQDEET